MDALHTLAELQRQWALIRIRDGDVGKVLHSKSRQSFLRPSLGEERRGEGSPKGSRRIELGLRL
jgi:hypothetical protein